MEAGGELTETGDVRKSKAVNLMLSTAFRRLMGVVALSAATAALLVSCGERQADPDATQGTTPSVILIVIDTLRADYLGTYGFDGPISPTLDELAEESVLFESCSSQAPWTTPSIAAMMTSLYPEAHGVRLAPDDPRDLRSWRKRWTRAIPDSTTTLAESLRDRGYRTAAFIANSFLARGLGFEQGFDTFDESAAVNRDRDSSMLLHAGLRWLRSMESTGDPTFLYLHLMDAHGPYTAPETDFQAVRGSAGLGAAEILPPRGLRRIQAYLRTPRWAGNRDHNELRVWRGRYAAGVHAADRRLGRFIKALRDEGLWDSQFVVVTSDHGEELFDHGGWDHGYNLHEHQLHVPLIIRLPKGHLGGTRVADLVRLVDLMPTLLDLSGADVPLGMIGLDLLPLAARLEGEDTRRLAFATSVKDHLSKTSIFDGRFKLISDLTKRQFRLYDIAADPEERTNLATAEPGIVERLSERLREEIGRVAPGESTTGEVGKIPQEQLDRLRELGYLQ